MIRNSIYACTKALAVVSTLALGGCFHDDDNNSSASSGGGGNTPPAGAAQFDSTNADAGMALATVLYSSVTDAMELLTATNDTASCYTGGSIVSTGTETASSYNVTVEFKDCSMYGVSLNGTLNANGTFNTATGDYSDNVSGSLTGSGLALSSFSLNNLSYSETGNDNSGDYTIDTLSFTYAPSSDGFAVSLLAPISGNINNFGCPDDPASGTLVLTGSSGTQVKATIANQVVTVEVDTGSGFTAIPNSPFACSDFF